MKFIHLSDLHLGKRVNEFSMLEDQRFILSEIMNIIVEEAPQAVLLAGDIYDKSVPLPEAVTLFDQFVTELRDNRIQLLLAGGNHDSQERLAFGHRLFEDAGIHIAPLFDGSLKSVVIEDEFGPVIFHLMPFMRPARLRPFFEDFEPENQQQAVDKLLSTIRTEGGRHVLIAHLFVNGSLRCASEDTVGTLDGVSCESFSAFVYTALGHLHGPQQFCGGRVRYCGSPLKYSFSEAAQQKSVTVVQLDGNGEATVKERPLVPLHDMRELRGSYEELTRRESYKDTATDDYLHITLTDEEEIFEATARLRLIYPHLMTLSYDNSRTRAEPDFSAACRAEAKTPLELFSELYKRQNGSELTKEQSDFVTVLIRELEEESA